MPSSCCVIGCTNKQSFYGYSMFGFPNDPEQKSQWVEAVSTKSWEPKQHHRICEVHFEPALIHFVGSRKELKKNAVPTLFCNCACLQSINEAEEKCIKKSEIMDEPSLMYRAAILDHPYCQNWVFLTEREKESEASAARKKSWKHDLDCNLVREALKNTPRKKDDTFSKGRPAIPINKLLINPTEKILINRTKRNKVTLKSQLRNALDENAKLKRQLTILKNTVIPSNFLNLKNMRIVQLEKIA